MTHFPILVVLNKDPIPYDIEELQKLNDKHDPLSIRILKVIANNHSFSDLIDGGLF